MTQFDIVCSQSEEESIKGSKYITDKSSNVFLFSSGNLLFKTLKILKNANEKSKNKNTFFK